MALKIKIKKTLLKRKVDNATVAGYYGRVVSNGKAAFDEIARNSTKNTTIHPNEAELAAKMLLEGVCEKLKEGYIVDMGPLGTLYPAVNGKWDTDPEALSLNDLTAKVNYRPSDDIAGAIRGASLSWAGANDDDDDDNNTPADEPEEDEGGNGGNGGGELIGD